MYAAYEAPAKDARANHPYARRRRSLRYTVPFAKPTSRIIARPAAALHRSKSFTKT